MKSTHKITTKTVYHNKWILLCFFVIFFQPLLVWNRVPFYYICEILQFMMWFLIFITQISEVKKWDIYLWVWTAFCCIQIVVISNNVGYSTANPEEAIERVLSLLFLVHFLDILFSRCRRREIVFFWKYLFCMLFLEIISILLYRMGVVNIYWLGIKTRATETIIAFLLLSLLLKDCIKKRWLHT
jgi:hypothetical protein